MIDLLLFSLHFLLAFALVAMLAAQYTLIRPGITTPSLRLAANLDPGYGASAVLLLGVGFSRVYWGVMLVAMDFNRVPRARASDFQEAGAPESTAPSPRGRN